MAIRRLSEKEISLIAAGEVVERPVSVLKELLENALDAGATKIEATLENGGNSLITVRDNGYGILKEEMAMALERHATSKIKEGDVVNFHYFGFRGEALPSIAAVSNLRLISRTETEDMAWEVTSKGGDTSQPSPTRGKVGTTVEVRDLFSYLPARLKFLKSPRVELAHCVDLINRMIFAHPEVEFSLTSNKKVIIEHKGEGLEKAFESVMGSKFVENSIEFSAESRGMRVKGRAALPTYDSGAGSLCYVNARIVKDKFFPITLKVAYQGLMFSQKQPAAVLFLELESHLVDVNVSPNKMEVRFMDERSVRGLIVGAVRAVLGAEAGRRVSSTIAEAAVERAAQQVQDNTAGQQAVGHAAVGHAAPKTAAERLPSGSNDLHAPEPRGLSDSAKFSFMRFPAGAANEAYKPPKALQATMDCNPKEQESSGYLGTAICQLANTYIVARSLNGLVIIDQHAAHERIILEQMKKEWETGSVRSQLLLLPEILVLDHSLVAFIEEHGPDLKRLGFGVRCFGATQVVVESKPAILENFDFREFFTNIATGWKNGEDASFAYENIEGIIGNIACKSSIKAGKSMSIEEMNSILRMMENTQFSAQCNHGRPTHTTFSVEDLEKLFKRTG